MYKIALFICSMLMLLKLSGQDVLTIQDAVAIGLENNFDVQIAQNTRRITDNNYTRGNAGFLPGITWSGGRNYSRQSVNQEFINGSSNEKNNATSNTWNTGVNLGWTVFDGMKMFRTYDKLNALTEIAALEEQIAMEDAVFNITLAYYDVILEKSRVRALDTTLRLSIERVELAKTRYEVGKSPKLEYLSAQVDYNSDYSALLAQRESFQRTKHNLNNLMGREIAIDFEVPDNIELDSSLILADLKERALVSNNALTRIKSNSAILDLESQEIKAEKFPVVDLNVGYSYNKLSSQAGFLLSNRTNGLNYGLSATWILFDGKNVQRRYENIRIEIENNNTRTEQLALLIMRDMENAHLNYTNSLRLFRLEQESLQVARESVAIALDRYRLGKTTFLELREAQVNAVRTFSRLVDAIYATKIAELQLLQLSGDLFQKSE